MEFLTKSRWSSKNNVRTIADLAESADIKSLINDYSP